jgi:exodeoxyribonuclease V gamma subunit
VPRGLPARLFAFACQNVSPDVLRVIAGAARAGPLHFYFHSPVRGWWGDLQLASEHLRADAMGDADDDNPLLRANGAAGRDFVRTLCDEDVVQPTHEFAFYRAPGPAPATAAGDPVGDLFAPRATEAGPLLHRMQRDLLERAPPPRTGAAGLPAFARTDPSVQVHSCHTRLREVQVLHAQLRALLEADPALQPRDIAVLTPDIDRYAPLVRAVFGLDGANAIPHAIADAGALATAPVAEAFAQLLALPQSRFGAGEVLALLGSTAIAERFDLAPVDLVAARDWLRAAGVRWGLDGEHRAATGDAGAGADDDRAFSWAWAFDRLLLGHASGDDTGIGAIAPLPLLEAGQLATLDRVLQALRRLAHWQRALQAPRPAADWAQALAQLVGDFFPEHARDPADRDAIDALRAHVAAFAQEAHAAAVATPVPADVLRAWFAAALADADPRQPFLTGGVTFARMVPMRLVPFKVICLLGMNDGDFPRREPPGALNRLAADLDGPRRRAGDRSVRDDDRGLFLQLFAAAGQVFYVSYLGQDPRSGEALPPSVVVSELVDVAARYFADAARARRDFTVLEALHPFSPAAFGGGEPVDARRTSFHPDWHAGATVTPGARAPVPPFAAPVPADAAPQREWTREQLLRALANPSREFLRERLGLRIAEPDDALPEDEPFALDDGLDRWQRDGRVLALCLARPDLDADALARRLLAEGRVAPGAAGRAALRRSLDALAPALEAWRDDGLVAQPLPYALDLDGIVLGGVLPQVTPAGLRQFSASQAHGKTLLALGLDALAWSALGLGGDIDRIVHGQPRLRLPPLSPAVARGKLRDLVTLALQAREQVLPFMPNAGLAFAREDDDAKATRRAAADWAGEFGEGGDPWVAVALRGAQPFTDAAATRAFADLARRVFRGLPGVDGVEDDAAAGDDDD